MRGKRHTGSAHARIAALAAEQHGVTSRSQLRGLGIGDDAIDRRLGHTLHPLHRGVYAVGHPKVGVEGRWMAAVLACGPGAVLSHASAAMLWGIRRRVSGGVVDVTAPTRRRGSAAIRVHCSALAPDELSVHCAIPTTTVARTLLDLGGVIGPAALERAVNEAEVQCLADETALVHLLARNSGRAGTSAARRLMALRGEGETITRSRLEEKFLAFLGRRRLPRPATNAVVEGFEVDCVWSSSGLIAELDGGAVHRTRLAFERDRERDRILTAAGWRVVRITWRQLHEQPTRVAADLRRLLRVRH